MKPSIVLLMFVVPMMICLDLMSGYTRSVPVETRILHDVALVISTMLFVKLRFREMLREAKNERDSD